MTEFSHSIDIPVAPERVFAFVSDVSNLPQFVPTTRSAEATGPGKVHVEGEAHGYHYSSDGHFYVDADHRLMRWGSGESGYRGELKIHEEPSGSRVEISLHLHDDAETPPEEEVTQNLQESLERLRSQLS